MKTIGEILQWDGRVPILAGESALTKNGLTTLGIDAVKCWTDWPVHYPTNSPIVVWYFSPFAYVYEHVQLENLKDPYLTPTQERALVEYIIFNDYFDEGILIEGLQTYMDFEGSTLEKLYPVADLFHCPHDYIDKWWYDAKSYPRT